MFKKLVFSLCLCAALLLLGFGLYATKGKTVTDTSKLHVSASFYPLYAFAKEVGGDRVDVVNMTPAGSEPHDYEPTPQLLASAYETKVFIYSGVQFEPWVGSFLKDYKNTVIEGSQGITLLSGQGETSALGSISKDPHYWLDPVLAQTVVDTIRDGLSKADPTNASYYETNARQYNEKLAQLNTSFAQGLASCTLHTVVSSHDAFSYLAYRYGFTVASIAGIEPDEEPSTARLAELSDLVKQKNIKYIFFEQLVSPRLAETIANETGAKTLVLDPLEGVSEEDQNKGKEYISIQYENLNNLRKALECQ